jgi:hypothetical protein
LQDHLRQAREMLKETSQTTGTQKNNRRTSGS